MRIHRARGLVAATLTVLCAPLGAHAQEAPHPQIVVEDPLFDAGTVGRGERIAHEFVIHNQGDATLSIQRVVPTCGCTAAEFDGTIAPGESGTVRAVLDTTTLRGFVSKKITVLSNDPERPSLRLTMKANVRPYVIVSPPANRFDHVSGGPTQVLTSSLWASDDTLLEVQSVQSPSPYITATFRRATEDELDYRGPEVQWLVITTLASDTPHGPIKGNLLVLTNHSVRPEVIIPQAGWVHPVLSVSPARIDLGRIAPDGTHRASVIVTNHGQQLFTVTGIDHDVPGLEAEIVEHESGKRLEIVLTVDGIRGTGDFAGTLLIHTDSEQYPVFEVPVQGTVQ